MILSEIFFIFAVYRDEIGRPPSCLSADKEVLD